MLLGLAACTSQLAWFILPFFYVLALKETKAATTTRMIGISLLVFLLVNSYYMLAAPKAFFDSVFGLFGLQTLAPYGSNMMQFSTAFYQLPYWYATLASALAIVFLLALFHAYGSSLKPLLAVATMAVFMFSWRNLGEYGIAVLPLAIAIYYCPNRLDRHDADILKSKMPIMYGIALLLLILVPAAVYAHGAFSSRRYIGVGSIMPRLSVGYSQSGPAFGLLGLNVSVANGQQVAKNVSLFIVSRSPNTASYLLGKNFHELGPYQNYTYEFNYTLPVVNNNTRLFLTIFTSNYIVSKRLSVSINYTQNATSIPFP